MNNSTKNLSYAFIALLFMQAISAISAESKGRNDGPFFYSYTTESGSVVFSDQPPPSSTKPKKITKESVKSIPSPTISEPPIIPSHGAKPQDIPTSLPPLPAAIRTTDAR